MSRQRTKLFCHAFGHRWLHSQESWQDGRCGATQRHRGLGISNGGDRRNKATIIPTDPRRRHHFQCPPLHPDMSGWCSVRGGLLLQHNPARRIHQFFFCIVGDEILSRSKLAIQIDVPQDPDQCSQLHGINLLGVYEFVQHEVQSLGKRARRLTVDGGWLDRIQGTNQEHGVVAYRRVIILLHKFLHLRKDHIRHEMVVHGFRACATQILEQVDASLRPLSQLFAIGLRHQWEQVIAKVELEDLFFLSDHPRTSPTEQISDNTETSRAILLGLFLAVTEPIRIVRVGSSRQRLRWLQLFIRGGLGCLCGK